MNRKYKKKQGQRRYGGKRRAVFRVERGCGEYESHSSKGLSVSMKISSDADANPKKYEQKVHEETRLICKIGFK